MPVAERREGQRHTDIDHGRPEAVAARETVAASLGQVWHDFRAWPPDQPFHDIVEHPAKKDGRREQERLASQAQEQ